MLTETAKTYRYPGVRPFSENEQHIFYGRNADSEKLYQLIQLEKLVLLYGKSGLGKSSLLNAGVLPMFDKNNMVVKIRLGVNTKESFLPVDTCLQKLPGGVSNAVLDKVGAGINTLWLRIKCMQYTRTENPETYILVFDQFEELFTYDMEDIKQFKKQLSDLLYAKVPGYISRAITNRLKDEPQYFSDEELEYLYKQPDVKVILSIRSDRMSLLNNLADHLPGILKTWYELKPLDSDAAIDAIVQPAKKEDDEENKYLTAPFLYAPETKKKMLDYLTAGGGKSIETFQLQTICQFAENLAIENENSKDSKRPFSIEPEMLGDLQKIFRRSYDSLIRGINSSKKRLAVRLLLEDKLIIDGNRISLPEIVLLKEQFIDKEILSYLHDVHHILRSESNSTGGISYELSHDTLVAPITEAKKEREEKLRLKKLEQEQQSEFIRKENERKEELRLAREEAKKEKLELERKRVMQRRIIIIISVAALISIAFGAFGILMWQKATAETKKVEIEKTRSDSLRKEAQQTLELFEAEAKARKTAEASSLVQKAKAYSSLGVNDLAIDALKKALEIDSANADAKELLKQKEKPGNSK